MANSQEDIDRMMLLNDLINRKNQDFAQYEREENPGWFNWLGDIGNKLKTKGQQNQVAALYQLRKLQESMESMPNPIEQMAGTAGMGLTKKQGRDKMLKDMLSNYGNKRMSELPQNTFMSKYMMGNLENPTAGDVGKMGLASLASASSVPLIAWLLMQQGTGAAAGAASQAGGGNGGASKIAEFLYGIGRGGNKISGAGGF